MKQFFSLCTILCLSANVNTAAAQLAGRAFLRAKLYSAGNNIVDGNIVAFDDIFSNDIDGYDAIKIMNPGENFAMTRHTRLLAVEARKNVTVTDTIFYDLSKLTLQTYQLKLTTENFPALTNAILVDAFTDTRMTVHTTHKDSSFYFFTVGTNPASAARDRFMLIISSLPLVVPVQLKALSAVQLYQTVKISWTASNETTMQHYEVESSRDAVSYEALGKITVKNENQPSHYEWVAPSAALGFTTYRIKAVNAANTITYSAPLFLVVKSVVASMQVLVVNKQHVSLRFNNQPAARYRILLYNATGQPILQRQVEIRSSSEIYNLALPQPSIPGSYFIEAVNTTNNQKTRLRFLQF